MAPISIALSVFGGIAKADVTQSRRKAPAQYEVANLTAQLLLEIAQDVRVRSSGELPPNGASAPGAYRS
jgi:hypothetical protein